MKKDDVLYRAKAGQFSFDEFKKHAQRSPSTTVTVAVNDVIKAKKKGEMKDPEVKIGLIGAHLYLRIKDGKTHVDDFLITKNFTPANDDEPVRDNAYKKKVADFIKSRKALLKDVSDGEAGIKAILVELKRDLQFAQGKVGEAERGAFGYNNPADKVDDLVKAAVVKLRTANDIFDDDIHPVFDEHRSVRAPVGVDSKDVSSYGGPFYLTSVKPVYKKAQEWLKLCNTLVDQMKASAKNARNFVDQSVAKLDSYRLMAVDLKGFAEQEVVAGEACFPSTTPIEDVAQSLTNDLASIKRIKETPPPDPTELPGMVRRYLDNSTGRVVGAKNGYSKLKKHGDNLNDVVSRAKEIPKAYLKDAQIKASLKDIVDAKKAFDGFVKSSNKHLTDAAKVFATIKKEAAKV